MHKKPPQPGVNAAAHCTAWLWLALVLATIVVFMGTLTGKAWSDESAPDAAQKLTLVELFTSQGCSSCPPADSFLKDLAQRPDVLALSFHVDYWDTEYWRDPFSSPSFSMRQRNYQDALATDYIYTPQVIVNGGFAVPGAQRAEILSEIETQADKGDPPELTLKRKAGDRIQVMASSSPNLETASLYVAVFDSSEVTRVRGGENRGRTLTNVNVVRRLVRLAPYEGKAIALDILRTDLGAASTDGIAVFIQAGAQGPVMSAAALMPTVDVTATTVSAQETRLSMRADPNSNQR